MSKQRKREVVIKHTSNIKITDKDIIKIDDIPILCELIDYYSDDHRTIESVKLKKLKTKHLEGMFTRQFLKEFKVNIFNNIQKALNSKEYMEEVNKEYDKHKKTVMAVKDTYNKVADDLKKEMQELKDANDYTDYEEINNDDEEETKETEQ